MKNHTRKKTILILGAGFAGCTTAYLLRQKGFKVTVLEKEKFPGGGCRTYWHGGHPYTLGPRIFFTQDKEIVKLMTGFIKIRQFYNKTWTYVANDKKFYHYPIYRGDLSKMPDFQEIHAQLKERRSKKPRTDNFEVYWLDVIGPNLYQKFINSYSKKMWGVESNKELSADFKWVNKGIPIREKDIRLYGDMFQGYPSAADGYNLIFNKMLKGCRFIPGCEIEYLNPKTEKIKTNKGEFGANIIVNTISADRLFKNKFGPLKYGGRKMLKVVLPIKQIIPGDVTWLHYSSGEEPFTRVTEFKKITNHKSKDTLLGIELPCQGGQHYPVQTEKEKRRFSQYQNLFPENFYSIGRLGGFSYKGISEVMRNALDISKTIE